MIPTDYSTGGVCAGGGGQEPDLRPHPAPREELSGADAGEHFLVHIFLHIFNIFFSSLSIFVVQVREVAQSVRNGAGKAALLLYNANQVNTSSHLANVNRWCI